jgi:hypothetical protein
VEAVRAVQIGQRSQAPRIAMRQSGAGRGDKALDGGPNSGGRADGVAGDHCDPTSHAMSEGSALVLAEEF